MHVSALEKGTNKIVFPTRVPGFSLSLIVSSKTSIEKHAHCHLSVRRPPPGSVCVCALHETLHRERRIDVHSSTPRLYKPASLNMPKRNNLGRGLFFGLYDSSASVAEHTYPFNERIALVAQKILLAQHTCLGVPFKVRGLLSPRQILISRIVSELTIVASQTHTHTNTHTSTNIAYFHGLERTKPR